MIWLALTSVATAAGVGAVWFVDGGIDRETAAWIAGLSAAAMAMILVPTGFFLTRSFGRLRQQIANMAEEGTPDPGLIRHSRLFTPVTLAVSGAVDHFRAREAALQTQLRDLDIRHLSLIHI